MQHYQKNRLTRLLAKTRLESLINEGQHNMTNLIDRQELEPLLKKSEGKKATEQDAARLCRSLANFELGDRFVEHHFWNDLPAEKRENFLCDLLLLIDRKERQSADELH